MELQECCKIYKNEGDRKAGALSDDKNDILIDDKAEVSRLAENLDEDRSLYGKTAENHSVKPTNHQGGGSKSATSIPAPSAHHLGASAGGVPPTMPLPSATNHRLPHQPFPLTIGCDGRYKTAFNPVSPSYAATAHSQAQFLQQIAVQHYYNDFINGRCPPFVGSQAPSVPIGSPDFGPHNPMSPFNNAANMYAAAAANSWLSALHLDQQAKSAAAGFGYHSPLFWGLPHAQTSPIFPIPVDPIHHMGNLSAGSFFNASPLQSPDTGSLIAPTGIGIHHPAPLLSMASLKLSASNGTHQNTLLNGSSVNVPAARPTPNSHGLSPGATNHLRAIGQFLVRPSGQTVAPSFASSLNNVCNSEPTSRSHNHSATGDKRTIQSNCQRLCKNGASSMSSRLPDKLGKYNPSGLTPNGQSIGPSTSYGTIEANRHNSTSQKHLQAQTQTFKQQHIKKPLNAFMLYMKEMRPSVMQEAGLKERQSAEINRILGRRWHSLTRDEQQKYYDLAKKERQDHLRKYPTWSARDNYAMNKTKKRKRDKTHDNLEAKKCRARFGLDQQCKWCKHCRRKKKCLWFKEADNSSENLDASPFAQVSSTSHGEDEQSSPLLAAVDQRNDSSSPSLSSRVKTAHANGTLKMEQSSVDENSPPDHVTSTLMATASLSSPDAIGARSDGSDAELRVTASSDDDDNDANCARGCTPLSVGDPPAVPAGLKLELVDRDS